MGLSKYVNTRKGDFIKRSNIFKGYNPGQLIFSTPPYNKNRRIIIILLHILAWILPVFWIVSVIQNKVHLITPEPLYIDILGNTCLISIFLIADYLLILIVIDKLLHQQFKIYENGITKFVKPLFNPLIKYREGEFIPFQVMKSFSISNEGYLCEIKLHSTDSSVIWDADNSEHIVLIIKSLKKHNIPEIK